MNVLANMIGVQRVDTGAGAVVQVSLNTGALREVLAPIAQLVDRGAANARFYFDDPTGQLVLISSARVGRKTDAATKHIKRSAPPCGSDTPAVAAGRRLARRGSAAAP